MTRLKAMQVDDLIEFIDTQQKHEHYDICAECGRKIIPPTPQFLVRGDYWVCNICAKNIEIHG